MNRLKRMMEKGAYGERTGRVAYVLKLETLPAAHSGFEWQEDASFSPADAVLEEPGLKEVFSAAIRTGHAIVRSRPPSEA